MSLPKTCDFAWQIDIILETFQHGVYDSLYTEIIPTYFRKRGEKKKRETVQLWKRIIYFDHKHTESSNCSNCRQLGFDLARCDKTIASANNEWEMFFSAVRK